MIFSSGRRQKKVCKEKCLFHCFIGISSTLGAKRAVQHALMAKSLFFNPIGMSFL
ncbi:MAG TPA: hypothetical protein PLZ29_00540 [Spirochaetota bacterium]|nr:hypothetical protein [Spirochaetota bacterium]